MSSVTSINPDRISVHEVFQNIVKDGNFKEGLWLGLREDGEIVLHCSSLTYAQLCFLKCSLDIFVDTTLKGGR